MAISGQDHQPVPGLPGVGLVINASEYIGPRDHIISGFINIAGHGIINNLEAGELVIIGGAIWPE